MLAARCLGVEDGGWWSAVEMNRNLSLKEG